MDGHTSRSKEYPSLSYHKSPNSCQRGGRISIGNLNDNMVGGEKKRHVKKYNENYDDDRINGENRNHSEDKYQPRRRKQSVEDDYDEEFRRMSIGSPIPNTLVNPDGSPRKQTRGHYPSIKVDQVKESDGRHRGRYNHRQLNKHQDEYDYEQENDEQKIPKSPASPLVSPRNRNGDHGADRSRRMPPPASPRLLRSRSPNNLSPRTPSPSPRVAGGKEYIAYYEEDLDLRPKSTSPRDKKQERIPCLGNKVNFESQPSYSKKKSPRDSDGGDNFDWNDYISPRSKSSKTHYDDEYEEGDNDYRSKRSPREYDGPSGRRRERGRGSVESPPLSPLSSSGGSSSRSPKGSPRSPDDVRSSWESPRSEKEYFSSSVDRSPRGDTRSSLIPPVSRRKKQAPTGGRLEPIDFR